MSTLVPTRKLLTAEEYGRMPDNGKRTELVRGRIMEMNVPYPRHGQICTNVVRKVGRHLDRHDTGHLLCNDAAVQTENDPDTMRGADVAYISYKRRPRGPLPRNSYIPEVPELIFEVRSPTDRWSKIALKAGEYIEAGVEKVCVLDEQTHTAHVYSAEEQVRIFKGDEKLTFPDILPGFSVKVGELFE